MQTLGISDSTPETESRLKSLFWPSINTANDVDYLGTQGYWICTVVAVASFFFTALLGHPLVGLFVLLFYYLGGVGVRERSRYAATVVFTAYAFEILLSGIGVIRVLFSALLLSNLRAIWIAATWRPEADAAALPPRLSETWSDRLSDQFPTWLWPKIRIAYYVFSGAYIIAVIIGLWTVLARRLAV